MTVTDPWRPFPVRYYVFALLFLVFDVEAAFLYPVGRHLQEPRRLRFRGDGYLCLDPGVGLVYAWKKGALKWV